MSTATGDRGSVSMMVKAEELSLQESSLLPPPDDDGQRGSRQAALLPEIGRRERGVEDGSELVR